MSLIRQLQKLIHHYPKTQDVSVSEEVWKKLHKEMTEGLPTFEPVHTLEINGHTVYSNDFLTEGNVWLFDAWSRFAEEKIQVPE